MFVLKGMFNNKWIRQRCVNVVDFDLVVVFVFVVKGKKRVSFFLFFMLVRPFSLSLPLSPSLVISRRFVLLQDSLLQFDSINDKKPCNTYAYVFCCVVSPFVCFSSSSFSSFLLFENFFFLTVCTCAVCSVPVCVLVLLFARVWLCT